jgi:hypothetical protein
MQPHRHVLTTLLFKYLSYHSQCLDILQLSTCCVSPSPHHLIWNVKPSLCTICLRNLSPTMNGNMELIPSPLFCIIYCTCDPFSFPPNQNAGTFLSWQHTLPKIHRHLLYFFICCSTQVFISWFITFSSRGKKNTPNLTEIFTVSSLHNSKNILHKTFF